MYLVLDAEGVLYGWNPPNNNKIDLEYANSLFLKSYKKLDLGEISYEDYVKLRSSNPALLEEYPFGAKYRACSFQESSFG